MKILLVIGTCQTNSEYNQPASVSIIAENCCTCLHMSYIVTTDIL